MKSAFLQGHSIEREYFIEPLAEFKRAQDNPEIKNMCLSFK